MQNLTQALTQIAPTRLRIDNGKGWGSYDIIEIGDDFIKARRRNPQPSAIRFIPIRGIRAIELVDG
jgi:hypothetical protein